MSLFELVQEIKEIEAKKKVLTFAETENESIQDAEVRSRDKFKSYKILSTYTKSSAPKGIITKVSFSIRDEEELLRNSVCEVTDSRSQNKSDPRLNTLNDLRLGPSEPNQRCLTCDGDLDECRGHFGHIRLLQPVYWVSFIPFVYQVVVCVCWNCGELLLKRNHPQYKKIMAMKNPIQRLAKLAKVSMAIDYCGGPPAAAPAVETASTLKRAKLEQFDAEKYLHRTGTASNNSGIYSGCHALQRVYVRPKKDLLTIRAFERIPRELRVTRKSAAPADGANNSAVNNAMEIDDDDVENDSKSKSVKGRSKTKASLATKRKKGGAAAPKKRRGKKGNSDSEGDDMGEDVDSEFEDANENEQQQEDENGQSEADEEADEQEEDADDDNEDNQDEEAKDNDDDDDDKPLSSAVRRPRVVAGKPSTVHEEAEDDEDNESSSESDDEDDDEDDDSSTSEDADDDNLDTSALTSSRLLIGRLNIQEEHSDSEIDDMEDADVIYDERTGTVSLVKQEVHTSASIPQPLAPLALSLPQQQPSTFNFRPLVMHINEKLEIPFCSLSTFKQRKLPHNDVERLPEFGRELYFTAADFRTIAKRINPADYYMLGFGADSKPQSMCTSVFPVSPPPMRLRIGTKSTDFSKGKGDTDATKHLKLIFNFNRDAKTHYQQILTMLTKRGSGAVLTAADNEAFEKTYAKLISALDNLQLAAACYVSREDAGITSSNNAHSKFPKKSVIDAWLYKQGRVRGGMCVKRVDYSGRDVIIPATNYDMDEAGLPIYLCIRITKPEIVNKYNVKRLTRAVCNGPDIYPGAKYIFKTNGEKIDLRYTRCQRKILEYGDRVERHIIKNDKMILNRQPSLHCPSMMGHRCIPHNGLAIKLPTPVTTPYNADFDGDEMNVHIPQTLEAEVEVEQLMMCAHQINGVQDRAIIGVKQNSLIGAYIMSKKDIYFTEPEVHNIFCALRYWKGHGKSDLLSYVPLPAIVIRTTASACGAGGGASKQQSVKFQKFWTGKQMLSIPFSQRLFYGPQSLTLAQLWGDSAVCFVYGLLCCGRLTSKELAATRGSIWQQSIPDFGKEITRQQLSDFPRVIAVWMQKHGIAARLEDLMTTTATRQENHRVLTSTIQNLSKPEYADLDVDSKLEVLDQARDHTGALALQDSLKTGQSNVFMDSIESGTKGSNVNMAQALGSVGQFKVKGQILPLSYISRTLPHVVPWNRDVRTRGFVKNCYMKGLTPIECYFGAEAGREGLAESATKISEVGYLSRRLIKGMEDCRVAYDATVRFLGDVTAFCYGEDGINPAFLQKQSYPIIAHTRQQIIEQYDARRYSELFTASQNRNFVVQQQQRLQEEVETIISYTVRLRKFKLSMDLVGAQREDENFSSEIKAPVHFSHLIHLANRGAYDTEVLQHLPVFQTRSIQDHSYWQQPLDLITVLDRVPRLVQRCRSYLPSPSPLLQFMAPLYLNLSCVNLLVLRRKKLTRLNFEWLVHEIESQFRASLQQPGESVGIIAGQSIGEPSAQMSLNAFHNAGLANKQVHLAIPRLNEIVRSAKKSAHPTTNIPILDCYQNRPECIQYVKSILDHLTVKQILLSHTILYEPTSCASQAASATDAWLKELYRDLIPAEEMQNLSDYVIRFELNRDKCLQYQKSIEQIQTLLQAKLQGPHLWIRSPANARYWIIRVRVRRDTIEYDRFKKRKVVGGSNIVTASAAPAGVTVPSGVATSLLKNPSQSLSLTSNSSTDNDKRTKSFYTAEDNSMNAELLLNNNTTNSNNGTFTPYVTLGVHVDERRVVERIYHWLLIVTVNGLNKIKDVSVEKNFDWKWNSDTLEMQHYEYNTLDMSGINLREVSLLPGVDPSRLYTNDIAQIELLLDVDAAVLAVFLETKKIFQYNNSYVNDRAIWQKAFFMGKSGAMVGFTRTGFNEDPKLGVLKKMSFEKIDQVIMQAALTGGEDRMECIGSNVIMGRPTPIGTNTFNLQYDLSAAFHSPEQKQEFDRVSRKNHRLLEQRLLDPISAADLIRLVPTASSLILGKQMQNYYPPQTYQHEKYEKLLAGMVTVKTVPTYDHLLVDGDVDARLLSELSNQASQQADPGSDISASGDHKLKTVASTTRRRGSRPPPNRNTSAVLSVATATTVGNSQLSALLAIERASFAPVTTRIPKLSPFCGSVYVSVRYQPVGERVKQEFLIQQTGGIHLIRVLQSQMDLRWKAALAGSNRAMVQSYQPQQPHNESQQQQQQSVNRQYPLQASRVQSLKTPRDIFNTLSHK